MPNIIKTVASAFNQETISDTALFLTDMTFTDAQVEAASRAIIAVRSGSINIRYDGTSPTTDVGLNFVAGNFFQIDGNADIRTLELIRNGASDAVVDISLEQ